MAAITVTDLNNAKLDVDHMAELATSDAPTATDRLGNTKATLSGLIAEFPNASEDAAEAFISASLASAAATDAELAKTAAELASDAATLSGEVYASTTAGLAATAADGFFSVLGADANSYLTLYRKTSGVAVEYKRYPTVQRIADVENAFDIVEPKNKYNPLLAENGFVYDYVTGTKDALATGIVSGRVPVVAGLTYMLSIPSPESGAFPHIYCWDIAGTYLGMEAVVGGGNAVVPGINLVASDPGGTGGYRRLRFTVPAGVSFVGFHLLFPYVAHDTTTFNRIRTSTQIEIGTVATDFVEYSALAETSVKEEKIPETIQRAAPVAPILDAFEVEAQRNLYDLSNAVDGKIIDYSTGLNDTFANGISLGYFPVSAGQTYVVSMSAALGFHPDHALYCRDATEVFLGIDHTIGGTPGMASPPTSVTWTGNSQVVFTIPPGSLIAYIGLMCAYSAHTFDDFQIVINSVQAEVGTVPTEYQSYSPNGRAVLKAEAITVADGLLGVTRLGDDLYIRSEFDATHDLVQRVQLSTGIDFDNDTVNVMGTRKALRTVASAVSAYNNGQIIAVQGDSTAPLKYNGTYIGGNHGAAIVRQVTRAAHGKNVDDVGSVWTDGAAIQWCLMRVVDANTMWFVSANLSVAPAWSFTTSITGSTLTHSSGATHTSSITIDSSVLTQLWPSLQDQTRKVLMDGTREVAEDGSWRCNTVDIVNSYNVCNPASVRAYVRSQVGSGVQPSFTHPDVEADIRRSITYRFAENGSCTIIDGIRTFNSITLNHFGATQIEPLNYSSKQLWQYIPRVTPIVGGVKTWDFKSQENISGTFEELTLSTANWTDVNNVPDRMAQIVKTSGVAEFGVMVGYSPVRSVGLPALRKTLVTDAMFVSAIRKQYPIAVNGGTLPANSYFEIVAFRAFWPASANDDATAVTWYRDGRSVIMVADFHQNVTLSKIPVPSQFVGMDVSVVDKTSSLTVHGNGVSTADGILVSVTGSYGYVVLKLS